MKIAQITFYKTMNYGGTLQAYALNKVLSLYGECECIDFTNSNVSKKGFKAFFQKILYLKRKHSFDRFIKKYIKTSKVYDSLDELGKDYDYYVCGSDQIWNPEMMGGICSDFYFLNFGTNSIKRVAYAASIGKESVEPKYLPYFKKVISKFNAVSLREETCQKQLQQLTNTRVEVTIDPTLLLSKEEWENVCADVKKLPPYLLVYDLSASKEFTNAVNELSAKLNLPVVHFRSKKLYNNELKRCFGSGPAEFLSLIKNAEFVFCSSFHGTVFSIIFEKNFYVWNSGKTSSRMKNLLATLGIENRLLYSPQFDIQDKVDYGEIKKKLDFLKENSMEYLLKNLKEVEDV